MKSVFTSLLLLAALLIVGCSSREQKSLNSFKSIVVYMSGLTNFYGKIKCSDFSYNVEKTDSVVSPFTGVITFKADIPHDLYEAYYAFTCQFAEQDGKWIHKKIDIEYKVVIDPDSNIKNTINDEVRDNIKAQTEQMHEPVVFYNKHYLDDELSVFLNCPKIDHEQLQ
jgi:hypothetical protein